MTWTSPPVPVEVVLFFMFAAVAMTCSLSPSNGERRWRLEFPLTQYMLSQLLRRGRVQVLGRIGSEDESTFRPRCAPAPPARPGTAGNWAGSPGGGGPGIRRGAGGKRGGAPGGGRG